MADLYGAGQLRLAESDLAGMEAARADLERRRALHATRLAENPARGSTAYRDDARAVEDLGDLLDQIDHGWGPLSPGSLKDELAAHGVDISRVRTLTWMRRRVEDLRTQLQHLAAAQGD